MYKNQLQELAQRSCFNLPSYACIREGPDHAPRFKASVNFNGEIFQGPSHCTTLRQAEHAAAEVALTNLSSRAPSRSIAARVLDETGVYKNLLQETTHRAGLKLPAYTTVRSGPGHQPVFTSTVELAGMCIAGDPAKTKKQAEKNAAMAAWSSLKQMPDLESLARSRDASEGSSGGGGGEEQEQVVRYLYNLKPKEENKQARQREYCQQPQQKPKKRLFGFNDRTSSSASPHRSLRFQQQWRSLEPLADLSLIHPSQQQQKNCSFLAPAHSIGPKVMSPLLFTLNSPISLEPFSSKGTIKNSIFHPTSRPIQPIVVSSSSQPRSQEIQTSDGNNAERLQEKAIQGKQSSSSVRSHPFADSNTSVFAARAFSPPPRPNIPSPAAPPRNTSTNPVPRLMNTGGFHTHGIAPAVQIRSVIPVCAAPPMRQPPQPPVTNDLPASIPKKETENAISAAISKLNRLHL